MKQLLCFGISAGATRRHVVPRRPYIRKSTTGFRGRSDAVPLLSYDAVWTNHATDWVIFALQFAVGDVIQ
jgi:hypothetical protein